MASVIAWFQTNWMPLLVALLAVDQVLVGIFPNVPIFGSIAGWIKALMGQNPPAIK